MENRKINILLELMDDIIIKCPNNKKYILQNLHVKCNREEIPVDEVIFCKFRSKNIFTNQVYHITSSSQFSKIFTAQCLDVRLCELCIYLFEF